MSDCCQRLTVIFADGRRVQATVPAFCVDGESLRVVAIEVTPPEVVAAGLQSMGGETPATATLIRGLDALAAQEV